jgi:fengycin family lipopeptide synthetase B
VTCIVQEVCDSQFSPKIIGMPFGETKVHILSEERSIVPFGAVGELCISGPQLARGYFKDKEKTNAAFVDHPILKDEKMYKTGKL